MRRVIGRLLLATAAVLPLSVVLWGHSAQGAGPGPLVLKCGRFKGVMDVTPGLSDTPANQTISAHGRVSDCHGAGGEGKFSATLTLTGATCGARRFEAAQGQAQFAWADGRSSTSSLTLVPSSVNPNKAEVYGTVTGGAFLGTELRSGMRMTDTFTGSGPQCGPANLVRRIDFTNYHCFMLYEPRTTTTTVRHAPASHAMQHRAGLVRQVVSPPRPAAPSPRIGSLALTGSNSGGALVGVGSLIVGGAIWALAGHGRSHHAARTTRRRRRARPWLYVTMPGNPI
jgi:hypothetical protein